MNLYEVSFSLDSGYTLNMLMAGPDADNAISEANKVLRTASEPYGDGDAMRYGWRYDDVTAKPVSLADQATAADDDAPDLASALSDALSIIDYMNAGDGSMPLLGASKLARAREALAAHS